LTRARRLKTTEPFSLQYGIKGRGKDNQIKGHHKGHPYLCV